MTTSSLLCVSLMFVAAHAAVEVRVALRERDMDKLERYFHDVSNPTHPSYGKYLDVKEMRNRHGVSESDHETAKRWLEGKGAQYVALSPAGTHLYATMELGQAMEIEKKTYHHDGPAVVQFLWVVPSEEVMQRTRAAANASVVPLNRQAHLRQAMKGTLGDSEPNTIKKAMGVPTGVITKTSTNNTQMAWGTGTYGVQPADLDYFWSLWEVKGMKKSLMKYEGKMGDDGDNYKEGCLDAEYLTGTGNGIKTIISNSNTSKDAEEGLGYGRSLLTFATELTNSDSIPHVLSLSIGSLSFASCAKLCDLVQAEGSSGYDHCWTYLTTTQRQVCMFESQAQTDGINTAFMKLGTMGMSIFAASGDGGSHWAFGPFDDDGIGKALNTVGCKYNWPVFPAESPYVTSVGGTDVVDNQKPWVASGGGFSWTSGQPAWQASAVGAYLQAAAQEKIWPKQGAMNSTNRGYPDVAAYAGEVPYVEKDSPGGLMGTSVACPIFAGVVSLLNDLRLQAGLPVLGFVNPRLYQTVAAHPAEAFQTMSSGSSRCDAGGDCCDTGYPVLDKLWNPVTGLGWPKWAGLSKFLVAKP